MKVFLIFSALFFLVHLQCVTGQEDDNRRMAAFLNASLAGFSNWIKQNGCVPDPLSFNSNFTLKSSYSRAFLTEKLRNKFHQDNETSYSEYYNFAGEISDRFYHGSENNIRALDISVNMSTMRFSVDLGFGDINDSIQGSYFINGTIFNRMAIFGNGTFIKTNQLRDPLSKKENCWLQVTPIGYFRILICGGFGYAPIFTNLTLNGLNASSSDAITKIVDSWYDAQFQLNNYPNIGLYWISYMDEIFASTPIHQIIGRKLAATVQKSGNKLDEIFNYKREPYFDVIKGEWAMKTSVERKFLEN